MKDTLQKILPELLEIRRYLHQYPELSFNEKNTSEFIKKVLDGWNISYTGEWAGHGIVGLIQGRSKGTKVVALRADMDALPIQESTDLPFSSKNQGIMHACGHDVHMTCLLGAIYLLNNSKDSWEGQIKFIFQPAEEKLPGGAKLMIEEGVLTNPLPDVIIGQHVQPNMEVGRVGLCPGIAMASCDEIYLEIIGKGGHAAMPSLCINPIGVSALIITELNQLLDRNNVHQIPSVLSVGKFNTEGGATNIIPEKVKLEGTFRCMNEDFRSLIHQRIEDVVSEVCKKNSCSYRLNIEKGYPCLINDFQYAELFFEHTKEILGDSNVDKLAYRMTSEDFSYYSQSIPAIFYRLGTGESSGVHTPQFTVNEKSIYFGSLIMSSVARQILSNT